jgi:hypothetical protein
LSTPVEKRRNSRATGKNPGIFWGCCLPYGGIIIVINLLQEITEVQ